MDKRTIIKAFVLFAAVAAALLDCSRMTVTGGGTEGGNVGRVTGSFVMIDGALPGATEVELIPASYDPVLSQLADTLAIDTSSLQGNYEFHNVKYGLYNVQAVNHAAGTRALITGIDIEKTGVSGDVFRVPVDTMRSPGRISVMLFDALDSAFGYVYVPGTEIIGFFGPGSGSVAIDSVPSAVLPSIFCEHLSGVKQSVVIAHNIRVVPDSTVTVQPYSLWSNSKKIFLNTTSSGANVIGNVVNFPVFIRLTSGNFTFAQANADGSDIRFAKSNGAVLSYEIERWDSVNAQAEIWVKVDTVFGNSNSQYITMFWGASSSGSVSNSAVVFDTANGFSGVWHMNDSPVSATGDSNDVVKDATANGFNGSARGAMTNADLVAGQAGLGLKFDGSDDFIDIGALNIQQAITLEAWIKPLKYPDSSAIDTANSNDAMVIAKYDGYTLELQRDGNLETVDTYAHSNSYKLNTQTFKIALNTWYHVAMTYDGAAIKLFVNGQMIANMPGTGLFYQSATHTLFGSIVNYPGVNRFFAGTMDEVRISSVSRSSDWIALDAANQNAANTLVQFK